MLVFLFFHLLAIPVGVKSHEVALESGQFVPLVEEAGFLACPQSLKTLDGLGHCVNIAPLAAVRAASNSGGADLFARCIAQMRAPQGGTYTYQFPFLRWDADSDVPMFEKPIMLTPATFKGYPVHPESIWKSPSDGSVRGLTVAPGLIHLLTLTDDHKWLVEKSIQFSHPGFSKASLVIEGVDEQLTIYSVVQTGNSSRALNLFPYNQNWRAKGYEPFSGSGIYRGQVPLFGVWAISMYKNASFGTNRVLTPAGWTGGILGLSVGHLENKDGSRTLVGGTRNGLIFTIPDTPGAQPTAAVDVTTNALFVSKIIAAKPLGYPGKLGTEGLIVGGENGLHYTNIRSTLANGRLELQYAGKVLEKGAVLVTGQTPTVSVADWDGDGLEDLIAGSSEGRIYFSKRSKLGGFHRPVPLATGAEEVFSAEIVVQGGYRTDIQGPRENRWGYTAPYAVDWNGDGLMDILSSDNSAQVLVYMRFQAGNGQVRLRQGVPLKLDGLPLHGTWRNGPAAANFNGAMAVVTSDEQDEAHLYIRVDDFNVEDGGKLLVRNPKTNQLQPIGPVNYLLAGATGRLKYSLVDFNNDGKLDLLLGTNGYHSIPSPDHGLPACTNGTCHDNGATALVLFQSKQGTADISRRQLIFEWPKWITTQGFRVSYGGQELGIAPLKDKDGNIGLIFATPGGRHVFWEAKDLNVSSTEPPLN